MFRFDSVDHAYILTATGEQRPHITGMLVEGGYIDPRWFTEESRRRGTAVHRMTADYDLGAITNVAKVEAYRGYFLAYVAAMARVPHDWSYIEEPFMHPTQFWGGRPDRGGLMYDALAVLEVKTGPPEEAHPIQTALQAMLLEQEMRIPAHTIKRYALHLKSSGRFKLMEHTETARDFRRAEGLVRRFTA